MPAEVYAELPVLRAFRKTGMVIRRLHMDTRTLAAAVCAALTATVFPAGAADGRSFRAEVLFRLENPCPSTGATRGECKGYVIDRIIPVVCGGAEEPSNMQWQTLAEAKEKNRWERIGCRPGRRLVIPTPAVDAEVFPMEEAPAAPEVKPLPLG